MGKKEIVINAEKDQTRIAIVEDGKLAELFIESPENERTIGNICLGRIQRIMPSIRAAFVDIGQEQDAFLHFSDLTESLPQQLAFLKSDKPQVKKVMAAEKGNKKQQNNGKGRTDYNKLSSQLKNGQPILVKISKEPISHKGSRISTDLSIAGRFLVLVPFADYVAVSKKITSDKEQRRLKALAKSLLPDGFGAIVRTAAQGRNAKALDTDLRLLTEKWEYLEEHLAGSPKPPKMVHEDVNMVSSIMRDLFTTDYDQVLIDYPRLYRNIKSYIQAVAPQMVDVVRQHKGKQPVFEAVGIDQAVANAFKSRVALPSGGYLFIEHTEAMHVVDVNSGRAGRGMSQEESSLKVNMEAARTIARQTRLRDLGGIIVVDFIDLRSKKNRRKVYDELKKEFARDRAVSKILPMSDFGLVQITRQRLRPSLTKTFSGPEGAPVEEALPEEPARAHSRPQAATAASTPSEDAAPQKSTTEKQHEPTTSPDQPPSLPAEHPENDADTVHPRELVKEMNQWIAEYKSQGHRSAVTLRVHPFTAAYLNRRVPSYPTRWFMKHLVRVRMETDPQIAPSAFRFLDARSGEDVTSALPDQQNGRQAS